MIQASQLSLKILNRTFFASNNALTQGQPKARLVADTAATSTTIYFDNSVGFLANDYILIGNIGDRSAEIRKITSVTANAIVIPATAIDHYLDTPIYKIDYNQVELSRATTLTGTKSVLTTIDLNPTLLETIYADTTNTTGYGFFRFKNATVYSDYSTGISYVGNDDNSVYEIARKGCAKANQKIGGEYTQESDLINDIDEGQNEILNGTIDDSGNVVDWTFEISETDITSSVNKAFYDISSYLFKYPSNKKGVMSCIFGTKPLEFKNIRDMDNFYIGTGHSVLTVQANAGDTTITIADTTEFNDSGYVYLGGDTVSYTAVDDTTGILSGIPTTGSGSITTTHLVNEEVWQNIQPGEPRYFTIFNGIVKFDVPISINFSGKKIRIRFLIQLPNISSMNDSVEVPFYKALHDYVAYKIETRRKNFDIASNHKNEFKIKVMAAMKLYQSVVMQPYRYHTFNNTLDVGFAYNNDNQP